MLLLEICQKPGGGHYLPGSLKDVLPIQQLIELISLRYSEEPDVKKDPIDFLLDRNS